jgi:hypothetical protein
MRRGRSLARWVLRVSVSVGLAAYILTQKVAAADLRQTLAGVHPELLALGAVLYLAGQCLSAVKWRMLGRSVGFERSLGTYTRFYFIGMFFNVFGPSTLGGDVVRSLYLGDGRRPVLGVSSVVSDRMSGLAVLMALGAVALLASPEYHFPLPLTAAVVAGGIGLIVVWWTLPMLVGLLPTHNRFRHQVEHDLAPFWRDRDMLLRVVGVSLCFHLSQVVLQYLLARAAGAEVPFRYCLVFHPLLAFLTALPVSVSGLGIREASYLVFLGRIGIAGPVAVTVGLLWWLVTLIGGVVGGAVFVGAGAHLPRIRAKREPHPKAAVGRDQPASYVGSAADDVATPSPPPARSVPA